MDDQVHFDHDPYRSRKSEQRTMMAVEQQHDSQRANSYLPYSNHPPDITQAKTMLYLNEEQDALSSLATAGGGGRPPPNNFLHSNRLDLLQHDGGPSRSMLSATTMSLLFKAAPVRKENTTLSLEIARKKRKLSPQQRRRCWCHILFSVITLILLTGGLIAFFCWPRTPHILMDDNAQTMHTPADWGQDNQAFLRATWLVNVTFDNSQNWIPTHINYMELYLVDALHQDKQFGMAENTLTLAPRKSTLLQLVFHISYDAASVNDPTFQNLYNACGPKKLGTPPDLAVAIQGQLHIRGLAWSQHVTTTPSTGKFLCPTV
ncbi:hypothetical protein BDB00DRAFT_819425 [Zychaea mexicana]|uniref:uncharacterized protein n=1 Tax=Zychaea mexicana TaxID=64656 RepID=UPI0022FDB7CF|nr:uncharacterized protein BDB00DRAFT_819425 [Zychaea mexicana]KAI9494253.1 hypothetical protein BDB00DRAFT_819425 [Zychaea mexicana]